MVTEAKSDQIPLILDLDGTLIFGDTLWESFFALPKINFLAFLTCLFSLVRGRAAFKQAIAKHYAPSNDDLLFNQPLLDYAKDQSSKRPVILATAANSAIAFSVTKDLGFITHVIASDADNNIKGATKLAAIEKHLAENGMGPKFDYAGDSPADRPLWERANEVIVVAPSEADATACAGGPTVTRYFKSPKASLANYIKAARPHQWVKNTLIFLPLFLSHKILEPDKILLAVIAFASFSLCASATYIWNDIFDIRVDRAHPRKRNRPFASSAISIPTGIIYSLALLVIGFGLAATLLPLAVVFLFAGYIAFTVTYSLFLKEKLLVDALTLGLLYGYRIMIGSAATSIAVSDWLFAFSVFFFLGLALVKRYSEISAVTADAPDKIAGRGYYKGDKDIISMLGVGSSLISIMIMSLYITSPDVVELYSRPQILWLISLVMIYWISRVWVLAHRGHMPDDPIVFAIGDRISILCGLICVGVILLAT